MNKKKQPGIKFENIFLVEENFRRQAQVSQNLEIKLDFNVERHFDENHGHISLKTILMLINEKKETEVELDFSYVAVFREIEGSENMKMTDFLEKNAPALMFPYIRQHIHNKTTISGLKPLILPPVNIVALLSKKQEKSDKGILQKQ